MSVKNGRMTLYLHFSLPHSCAFGKKVLNLHDALRAENLYFSNNDMELDKFDRQLRLLVLLTTEHSLSVDDISRKLDMSRRSIYRYIDAFRALGFNVRKVGTRYSIDCDSPFFVHISNQIHFSQDEAAILARLLSERFDPTPAERALRDKLASLYELDALRRRGYKDVQATNLATLFQAVRQERMAVFHDYRSARQDEPADYVVEPYLFMADNMEVRAYELSTGCNRTFRVDSIGRVEMLDMLWTHTAAHAPFYTDLFHFSGEQRFRVKLLMGHVATGLLLENYPGADAYMKLADDGRHELDVPVCSFAGVGRFVLGIFSDIEVLGSPEFIEWLRARVASMSEKMESMPVKRKK